jgi:hypothetical protein
MEHIQYVVYQMLLLIIRKYLLREFRAVGGRAL